MFDKFVDYMYYLLFTPLKKVIKKDNQFYIFFKVAGKIFDDIKEDIFKVREESMIFTASEEMLQEHGKDRNMIKLNGETEDNYRKRLMMKAIISELAGTNEGVILAIKSLGFEDVELIPCYILDSDRWAEFNINLKFNIHDELPISLNILKSVVRDVKQASALPNYNLIYICSVRINQMCKVPSVTFHMKTSNYYKQGHKFDGQIKFDGTHTFRVIRNKNAALGKLKVIYNIKNIQNVSNKFNFLYVISNSSNSSIKTKYSFKKDNKQMSTVNNMTCNKRNINRESVKCSITIDTIYKFDGKAKFNGTRKFNAKIIKEEL